MRAAANFLVANYGRVHGEEAATHPRKPRQPVLWTDGISVWLHSVAKSFAKKLETTDAYSKGQDRRSAVKDVAFTAIPILEFLFASSSILKLGLLHFVRNGCIDLCTKPVFDKPCLKCIYTTCARQITNDDRARNRSQLRLPESTNGGAGGNPRL